MKSITHININTSCVDWEHIFFPNSKFEQKIEQNVPQGPTSVFVLLVQSMVRDLVYWIKGMLTQEAILRDTHRKNVLIP